VLAASGKRPGVAPLCIVFRLHVGKPVLQILHREVFCRLLRMRRDGSRRRTAKRSDAKSTNRPHPRLAAVIRDCRDRADLAAVRRADREAPGRRSSSSSIR
jgi:hypothetical protein